MNQHVILAGDSIFDNASYVPGEPCVTEQLRTRLGAEWSVSMIAVDGDRVGHVPQQIRSLPEGGTHVLVSVGGNDALRHGGKLSNDYQSSGDLFNEWAGIQDDFRRQYAEMLEEVLALGLPTGVCTIYDAVPTIPAAAVTALSLFNDVIVAEAADHGVPIADLRLVCVDKDDYSELSPIEPSCKGGEKITKALARLVEGHDFSSGRTSIYR